MTKTKRLLSRACGVVVLIAAALGAKDLVQAQDATPQMLDPSLSVRTVVSGLTVPIGLAFLASNDLLVLEKDSGEVKRVVDGTVTSTVLDLGVNFYFRAGTLGHCAAPGLSIRSWRVLVLDLPQHHATGRPLLSG